jgi:hypothetical protein
MATAIVKGFDTSRKDQEAVCDELKQSVDIYARAVDAYAKRAETYMQEMLALGAKVDRPEKQIEQIAEHLHLKLTPAQHKRLLVLSRYQGVSPGILCL